MAEVLKNDFKWSVSRDRTFRECPRQYWFNHYGFWGGWEPDEDQRTREIYTLKQLRTRPVWVGDVVHRCIKQSLQNVSRGIAVLPVDRIFAITRDLMRWEFRESRDGLYRQDPRSAYALFEHEYRVHVTDAEWLDAAETVDRCLRVFYDSPVWERLSATRPADFLEIESFSRFALDNVEVVLKMDCATRETDRVVVWEWKTGRRVRPDAQLQLACYAFYVHQAYGIPISGVEMRRFELATGEVHTRTIAERELTETLAYVRGSIADMRSLLDDPDRNVAHEGRFTKVSRREICSRCNFVRLCEPGLAPNAS
jgi:CRISPR/Cas system-associated exonuclease Cas4 (RecB family)